MFQCSNKTSMLLFLLLQVVLIVAVSAAHAEGDEGVTCHAGWDKTGVPREHVDEVCNRAAANDPKRIDTIVRRIHSSVQSGAARQLKDQKTSHCPDEGFETRRVMTPAIPKALHSVHRRAGSLPTAHRLPSWCRGCATSRESIQRCGHSTPTFRQHITTRGQSFNQENGTVFWCSSGTHFTFVN